MSTVIGAETPPSGVTPNFANPKDVLHTINLVTQILCMCLITPLYLMRMYVRTYVVRSFVREDCMCPLFCLSGMNLSLQSGLYNSMGIFPQSKIFIDSLQILAIGYCIAGILSKF
jgi:hypothetical protein